MKKPSIDIVITTYNGRHLLGKHLPNVIKHSPGINQIIVVDDGGGDDTTEFLQKSYPEVTYLKNPHNIGFTKSTNRGVAQSKADLVVLLNNDVSPQKDYLKKAIKYFQDKKVFAITFNEIHSSWPQVSWKKGKLHFTQGEDKTLARFSAWASGGSSIIKRALWNELGGFNEVYSPGYWEDIDLGWRAWKNGYKIIWDPLSTVNHQHESTFKKLDPNFINLIKQRNELLFLWQNITDLSLRASHLSFLLTHSLAHPGYFKVILAAIKSLPRLKRHQSTVSDLSILNQINNIYE